MRLVFETAKQLIRSAGSVGANYRASVRARSSADFIYKIEIVLEEADESHYWLEVVKDAGLQNGDALDRLIKGVYLKLSPHYQDRGR